MYQDRKKNHLVRAEYRVLGAIFFVNRNHFIARWDVGFPGAIKLVHMNCAVMSRPREMNSTDWYDGIAKKDGIVMVFYRNLQMQTVTSSIRIGETI